MSNIKRILEILDVSERKSALALIFLTIFGAILEAAGIGLIIPILTVISKNNISESYPKLQGILNFIGNPSQKQLVLGAMFFLVAIYLIKNLFLAFLAWIQSKFTFDLQLNLSQRLFTIYIRQSYNFHLARNSAVLSTNIINEINLFTYNVISPSIMLLSEGSVVIGTAILLFTIEPVGATVILLLLSTAGISFHRITRSRITRWGEVRQHHDSMRIKHLLQGLNGIKDVKLSGREKEFLDQYYYHNSRSSRVGKMVTTLQQLPRLWIEFLAILGLALLVIIMYLQGKEIAALLPTLGLFAAAAFRLMPSINRMVAGGQAVRFALPIISTIHHELNLNDFDVKERSTQSINFNDIIKLNNITYFYPSAPVAALTDVSVEIKKGDFIGFVGASGSGKSTLVDILLGLFIPTKGEVLVDGQNINQTLINWQKHIGYVSQSIYLIDDTLRRNIAFGLNDNEIDDDAIMRAIQSAQLEEFLYSLEEHLDTVVGERGVRLSGGQRQRIGIARALYHNPSILVLDEATSALDVSTEQSVMESITALQRQKTIVVVAHRLSTVKQCDRIYKFESGKIIAEGTPEQVLKAY